MATEAAIPEVVVTSLEVPATQVTADTPAPVPARTTRRRGKGKAPTVAYQRPPSLPSPLRFVRMYLDSRRDTGTSSVAKPVTDEEVASLLRSNPSEEEAYEPIGLLVTEGEEVTMALSLSQIENAIKQVSFLSFANLHSLCFDICS
ncbi:uncharacterized protein LOC130810180 isoform X3 [Amaranthus tricolor]|nr:uncharacterized protein LOC130810180 isoform X3 [Amaranthus tricolor]